MSSLIKGKIGLYNNAFAGNFKNIIKKITAAPLKSQPAHVHSL